MTTALFALIGLSLTLSPSSTQAEAERHFAAGVQARNDADAARIHFAKAANLYDELWRHPIHNSHLAKNRARAHRLAGNLPAAIAALHEGLAIARYDRELQVELESARDAVEYPPSDAASMCRPPASHGIATRMSPLEAFLIAGILWFASCLGIARFAMTRVPGWLLATSACFAGLTILGGLWWQDHNRRDRAAEQPLVIVSRDTLLRTGNGELWPERVPWRLPRGVEVRERTRRGGWIQVELTGGPIGWIPEAHALQPSVQ